MEKKNLYFNIYIENELEHDIELVGFADDMKALSKYFEKNKSTLYALGIKKIKGLRLNIEYNNKKYLIIVDSE